MKNKEQICTKESPMPKEHSGGWQHPDAIELYADYGQGGGVADGDYIRYECPNCKKRFWVELPN